jgi:hypothetical protein
MNNIETAVALATAPSSAYAEIRERPRFWFPLLLVVLSSVGLIFWYYSVVDIEWLKDAMYTNNPDFQKLPEEQRAATMNMMGRNMLLWSSVIGGLIALPVFFVLHALYFLLAAKATKMSIGFKHWFAFVSWSSLPLLIGTVVAAVLMLISDNNQISPSTMQALSLNELVMHRPMGAKGQAFFDSVTIPGFICWALMIIGVRTWSQRSWAFASIVVLLPIVAMYGIWAFFAFR